MKLGGRFEQVLEDGTFIVFEYLFEKREKLRYSYTEGLRYKLVLIIKFADEEEIRRVLLYDDFHESKPHVHIYDERYGYEFGGIEKLLLDFASEVKILTGISIEDWIREVRQEVLASPLKVFW